MVNNSLGLLLFRFFKVGYNLHIHMFGSTIFRKAFNFKDAIESFDEVVGHVGVYLYETYFPLRL